MSSYFAAMSGCQKVVPAGCVFNSAVSSAGLQSKSCIGLLGSLVSCTDVVPPDACCCSSASCMLACLATILALRGWLLVWEVYCFRASAVCFTRVCCMALMSCRTGKCFWQLEAGS